MIVSFEVFCVFCNLFCFNVLLELRAAKGEHAVCVSCCHIVCCGLRVESDVMLVMPGLMGHLFLLQRLRRVGTGGTEGLPEDGSQ